MSEKEKQFEISRVSGSGHNETDDVVAVEEPLEIRIVFGDVQRRRSRTLSVTMRTPGNDFELAVGFLVSEGIVACRDDVLSHSFPGVVPEGGVRSNTIELELHCELEFEFSKLQRHFYTTSSCGVCGKTSLDAIRADSVLPVQSQVKVTAERIHGLPDWLRREQTGFAQTGGLHAAGLVGATGDTILIREDVGRHNAADKLIGSRLLEGDFPLSDSILVLSGRASFELLQKALLASVPIVVAVGAPTSLAVEMAREFKMTLVGFTSRSRFNIYSGAERIV